MTATSLGRYSVECEVSDGGSAYINEGFKASSVVVKDPGKAINKFINVERNHIVNF